MIIPDKKDLLSEMDVLCHVIESLKSAAKSMWDDSKRNIVYTTVDEIALDLVNKYKLLKDNKLLKGE